MVLLDLLITKAINMRSFISGTVIYGWGIVTKAFQPSAANFG